MAEPLPREPGVLGRDYSFLVVDNEGAEHEVGPLVNQVLSLWANRGDDPDPGDEPVVPVGIVTIAAVEMGIQIAIGTLFGEGAREAFVEHCHDVARFLRDSDTARN